MEDSRRVMIQIKIKNQLTDKNGIITDVRKKIIFLPLDVCLIV